MYTKRSLFALLTILLTSASMHAMEDVRIVPFDPAKQSNALDLFKSLIDINILSNPNITINVLVKPRAKREDRVLGAIVYQTTDRSSITETEIKAVSVAREYRCKGYGQLLMQHVEKSIQTSKKDHHLFLQPINGKQSFYEQLGYAYEDTEIPFYMRKTISKE